MAAICTASIGAGATVCRINCSMPRRKRSVSYMLRFHPKKSKPFAAARRKDDGDGDDSDSSPQPMKLPIAKLAASSATVVFALGFVDAGYSGDWSRIGAISNETEELLKVASFLVIPFCFLLVISIFKTEVES